MVITRVDAAWIAKTLRFARDRHVSDTFEGLSSRTRAKLSEGPDDAYRSGAAVRNTGFPPQARLGQTRGGIHFLFAAEALLTIVRSLPRLAPRSG
jgi:hypothetical protein